ncbi:MAG: macro domain-containing protein [Deltaproteobacteria bacterium]|nr:macro domain-containing protein [Deltaproteobacteria bacterium]
MIHEGSGNLLDAKVEAVVNTVNTQGAMGKGIALQFKKAFPENFAEYELACERGEVVIGRVLVFTTVLPTPRYVINFPTKEHWKHPSKIEYIRDGLVDLVAQVRQRGIRSIAIPPLGCGLGGLPWSEVRPLIEGAFQDLAAVEVLLFPPGVSPMPEAMPNRTQRPSMTPGRAAILGLMDQYLRAEYEDGLSLLEVQKLAYFLQVAGEPLRLKFHRHHYGPYADNLRQVLSRLEGHYTIGYGEGRAGPFGQLRLLPDAGRLATEFLAAAVATRERLSRVAHLIEGFETPLGMELLATAHWIMAEDLTSRTDPDATITRVKDWNTRKARVMSPPQLRAAWERLQKTTWVFSG